MSGTSCGSRPKRYAARGHVTAKPSLDSRFTKPIIKLPSPAFKWLVHFLPLTDMRYARLEVLLSEVLLLEVLFFITYSIWPGEHEQECFSCLPMQRMSGFLSSRGSPDLAGEVSGGTFNSKHGRRSINGTFPGQRRACAPQHV